MTIKLYLCGSVTGRSAKDMREERQEAAEAVRAYGWVPVDPLAGEYDALKRKRHIQDDQSGLTFTSITLKDEYAIRQSGMMLWLTGDVASYGSCIEVGLAWALRIPIIVVDAKGIGRKNAFVSHISTYIGDTLDEALAFIDTFMTMLDAQA